MSKPGCWSNKKLPFLRRRPIDTFYVSSIPVSGSKDDCEDWLQVLLVGIRSQSCCSHLSTSDHRDPGLGSLGAFCVPEKGDRL